MLYRKMIAVCSEIRKKHVNTVCGYSDKYSPPVLHDRSQSMLYPRFWPWAYLEVTVSVRKVWMYLNTSDFNFMVPRFKPRLGNQKPLLTSRLSSVCPGKFWNSTSYYTCSLCSTSFLLVFSILFLPFDGEHSQLLTSFINTKNNN